MPGTEEYVPKGQSRHVSIEVARMKGEYFPALHSSHESTLMTAVALDQLPCGQKMQSEIFEADDKPEYVPCGQSTQLLCK
jgi:hypothetical protein